jgi:hypothetical protein
MAVSSNSLQPESGSGIMPETIPQSLMEPRTHGGIGLRRSVALRAAGVNGSISPNSKGDKVMRRRARSAQSAADA